MRSIENVQATMNDERRIHPATRLGAVELTVADLDRELAFYREVLGFALAARGNGVATLSSGGDGPGELLRLHEEPGARRARGATGLYHFALLVPTRLELAHLLRRIAETRTPIQGMVDHHTHLAIYLADPEGNGIELAWDFPKESWPRLDDGGKEFLSLGNGPLEPEELFAEIERDPREWLGLARGSVIGHVHLHVSRLGPALRFYHDLVGFDTIFDSERSGFGFVSAGGYHHHIGVNVWQGVGALAPPPRSLGLRSFTVVVPTGSELDRIASRIEAGGTPVERRADTMQARDPSQNLVTFEVAEIA